MISVKMRRTIIGHKIIATQNNWSEMRLVPLDPHSNLGENNSD